MNETACAAAKTSAWLFVCWLLGQFIGWLGLYAFMDANEWFFMSPWFLLPMFMIFIAWLWLGVPRMYREFKSGCSGEKT